MGDRAFIDRRFVWLAWHPMRRTLPRRGWTGWWERVEDEFEPERNGWSLGLGFGPLLLVLGPGTPRP